MNHQRLFTPGPTEVPSQVRECMARPLVHHRTEEYRTIQREVIENLQWLMKTKNPIFLLASSGTGAMEAAVSNLTGPGDKVLVTALGKFSHRWKEIGEAFGLDVVTIDTTWGDATTPELVAAAFDANPGISVLFTTHSETSTAVLQDVKSMARIAHERGALIVVDGITSIGAEVLETDAWGLDVVIGGAQKGVMIPPGLAYLSMSQAARERTERGRHPTYYFDLNKALKSYEDGDTPWTPPIVHVVGLHRALEMMKAEGLDNVIARHQRNAGATRAAVEALGLRLLSSSPASCTTAVVFDDGNADKVRSHLNDAYSIRVAGGQARLKGKIVRLGHLGYYFEADILMMITAFESTLLDLGLIENAGRGIEAALKEFHRAKKG